MKDQQRCDFANFIGSDLRYNRRSLWSWRYKNEIFVRHSYD
jgi:hypothetical protein